MSIPISRKVEKAITAWLPGVLSIDGMNYYEGHDRVDDIAFPSLVIYAEGSSPHPDMPAECGVRAVRLRCKFTADSGDSDRAALDGWKQSLEAAMTDDLPALQSALNRPTVGDDDRPVNGIHFHYVEMNDDPSDRSETDWVEDMVFNVVCEILDS